MSTIAERAAEWNATKGGLVHPMLDADALAIMRDAQTAECACGRPMNPASAECGPCKFAAWKNRAGV